MTPLERFAQEHNTTPGRVRQLRRLINRRSIAAEHKCNGDPSPLSANPEDKNENAKHWGAQVASLDESIQELAQRLNWSVDAGVGLYPVPQDAQGCYIHSIPEG